MLPILFILCIYIAPRKCEIDILYADASCCPQHATSPEGCINESGSSCAWLDQYDPFEKLLSEQEGTNCVGQGFLICKETNGINYVCNGPQKPSPGAPAPPSPICGPPPTPQPTPSGCELGTNYNFEGQSCIISGDPHTTMWNGNKHDFMGVPATNFGTDAAPSYKNQFYYIHPCIDSDKNKMPISILGTHWRLGSNTVTGLDYLTIILTDGNGDVYYVWLSWDIQAMANGAGKSTNYDNNYDGHLIQMSSNQVIPIGHRFSIHYTMDTTTRAISANIVIDGTDTATVYLYAQGCYIQNRYRCHYVQMSLPSSLKCYACGLCGDFKRISSGSGLTSQYMEACDGSEVEYRDGFINIPEVYDENGWTWEASYVRNTCIYDYNNRDNPQGIDTSDPCDPTTVIGQAVVTECTKQYDAQIACCNQIGGTFCNDLLRNCKIDVCLLINGNAGKIVEEVTEFMTTAITQVCDNGFLSGNMGNAPPPELHNTDFAFTSTETFTGGVTMDIGWIKYLSCEEGEGSVRVQYPFALSDIINLAQYAVTIKILPKGDIPGLREDSEYAVMADLCSNPVYAMNHGKEISYNLDINTGLVDGVTDINNWIGTDDAVARMQNKCLGHGLSIGSEPKDLITGLFYHGSCNGNGLHLYTNMCYFEYKQVPHGDISIWMGFHKQKNQQCQYTQTVTKDELFEMNKVPMVASMDNHILSIMVFVLILLCIAPIMYIYHQRKAYKTIKDGNDHLIV